MRHVLPSLTSGVSLNRMWVSVNVICSLNRMWVSVNAICVCYEPSSLLHWSLLLCKQLLVALASASSICLVYLSRLSVLSCYLENVKYQNSPLLDIQLLFYLPLLWSYRVSPGPGCQPISNSMRVVFLMFYQLSFTLGSALARCSGVSHDVLVVTARTYYVSPLVRRAFLHQFGLSIAHHHGG